VSRSALLIATSIVVAGAMIALAIIFKDGKAPALFNSTGKVKEVVAAELTDPGSAQFRNIREIEPGNYCGEVNAKTALGGYAGFTTFYAFEAETTDGKRKWFATVGGLGASHCALSR